LRSLELALAVMESARTGRAVHFAAGRPIFAEASR
jgi:hypothetical protein